MVGASGWQSPLCECCRRTLHQSISNNFPSMSTDTVISVADFDEANVGSIRRRHYRALRISSSPLELSIRPSLSDKRVRCGPFCHNSCR